MFLRVICTLACIKCHICTISRCLKLSIYSEMAGKFFWYSSLQGIFKEKASKHGEKGAWTSVSTSPGKFPLLSTRWRWRCTSRDFKTLASGSSLLFSLLQQFYSQKKKLYKYLFF